MSDTPTSNTSTWYIIKQADGHCEILPVLEEQSLSDSETASEQWGPFPTPEIAIAKRIGLIRAGKCRPA